MKMIEVVVIVESQGDAITATKLADRFLVEKVEWLEHETLEYSIKWRGLDVGSTYSCWKDVNDIIDRAKKAGIHFPRFRSNRRTDTLKADGARAMKVLNLVRCLQRSQEINGILLIRDLDHQQERRTGIEQARAEHTDISPKLEIIIGAADRMREAWVLNGFVPIDAQEKQALADLIDLLKFDPCEEAHRLRATSLDEPDRIRNPKVVLEKLTDGDKNREQQCWEETELEILRARGRNTGLTDYLEEIENRLLVILAR